MNTSFQGTSEKGTTTWLTPPWVKEPLGDFDMDPACPENMPWPTAKRMLTEKENGLIVKWDGRVWLNPPYSRSGMGKWLSKMANHNNGIVLTFSSTETQWCQRYILNAASSILLIEGRVNFCDITGKVPLDEKGNEQSPGKGSLLAAYGPENDSILKNQTTIPGKFILLLHENNKIKQLSAQLM